MKVHIHLPGRWTAAEGREVVVAAMREAERQRLLARETKRQERYARKREGAAA